MKNSESIMQYLKDLYEHDSLVSNLRVLQLVQQEYPDTQATMNTVQVWKTQLRREGVEIPYQRERK